jgi:diaminopimelate epimerase
MDYEIVTASPAKNITVFVLNQINDREERAALSKALLGDRRFKAEQIGFISPPSIGEREGLWHLEMMGGEFCGNAARSFGLFAAQRQGLRGKQKFAVSVSGANGPVTVEVELDAGGAGSGWAAAEMPLPRSCVFLDYKGKSLPALVFDGITHVIARGIKGDKKNFYAIKDLIERKLDPSKDRASLAAIGVMFYDEALAFMTPAVYVRETDSLVFESSCGSGTAAFAAWEAPEAPLDTQNGERLISVKQPGGVIDAVVKKAQGKTVAIFIGGPVFLSEIMSFSLPERRRSCSETGPY